MTQIPTQAVLLLALSGLAPATFADEQLSKSVVKIFTTSNSPDLSEPWKKQAAQESSGTGVVIEGKRILTNAHVVNHAANIRVQPDRSGDQLHATVESIAPDIDLAVLKLVDESFFDTHSPLPRAKALPRTRDQVLVAGYPTGGETLSTTGGIVSRIEYTQYYFGRAGLRIQIDAAVNPGNSGGPALVDGKMVGIVFSSLHQAQNIGYLIPNEEIDLFLADVADGHYDGKPVFRDIVQTVQNDALRSRLKLPRGTNGVLVMRPDRTDAEYPLKRLDVITKVADHPIDASGRIEVDGELRLWFSYFAQKTPRDGTLRLEILRDGKPMSVDLPVTTDSQRPLLMPYLFDAYPSYLVWGPLVFSPATQDSFLECETPAYAQVWLPHLARTNSPIMHRLMDHPAFEGEQLVLLTAKLPHRLTQGYPDTIFIVVDEVDGTRVRNFRHLAELLRDARGEDVTISFADKSASLFVFPRKAIEEASEEILSRSGIRKPYSDDLKPVFEPKK